MLFALGGIVCFVVAPGDWRPGAIVRRLAPIFVSAYFLFGGCLFIATNSETLILNAAYFVVGLVWMEARLVFEIWRAGSRFETKSAERTRQSEGPRNQALTG